MGSIQDFILFFRLVSSSRFRNKAPTQTVDRIPNSDLTREAVDVGCG